MDVFDLFAKISLDTSEYDGKLEKSKSGFSQFADFAQKGISTAVKVTSAAVAAGATATAVLVKNAIEGFADYEQLVGGVETLFKNSSDKVMQYAEKAYETAGLSSNKYMETVTSFSASLLQSLGGDTEKAADVADQAIRDMSDNSNKMGTSMESIQNAYQGFAKQNYTMLDNLKLGYGGTKEEMQRLLDDAQKISGIEYDLSSFADITEAIHVIQTELDITGTTSKEASTTISGSLNSMKAAWSNLIVGVADDQQDFDKLVGNFVDSVDTVAGNILPRVQTALEGAGKLIEKLVPSFMERIPTLINDTLPSLLQAGVNIVLSIVDGITSNLSKIVSGAQQILTQLGSAIATNLPTLIQSGLEIIVAIANAITDSLPQLIPAVVDVVLEIADTIIDNIDMMIDASIALILALAEGLINATPRLIDKAPEIIDKLVTAIIRNAGKLLQAAIELVVQLSVAFVQNAYLLTQKVPEFMDTVLRALIVGVAVVIQAGVKLVEKLWEGIKETTSWLWQQIQPWVTSQIEFIKGLFSAAVDIGTNLVEGIWNGISNGYGWITGKLSEWAGSVIAFLKKKFGIASPSKVMRDEVGHWLAEGIWQGFDDVDVMDKIDSSLSHSWDSLQGNLSVSANSGKGLINYDVMAEAMADAITGLTVEVSEREFGRVVRKVEVYA